MRPSQVKESVKFLTSIARPAFLWGPPGIYKSDVVHQAAHERKVALRDVRLSLLDPVDLKGFPTVSKDKKQMTWLPADFLPTEGEGILFLDEMNSAPQSVQAAAYQLILNRRIGDYVLPDGWAIMAAGNREGDRSVVNRMPSALANRLVHIDCEVNLDDWSAWAMDNGVHSDLLAFIRFKPDLLHAFDSNARAFPSPRSWMFVNQLIGNQLDKATEYELVKGTVGEGAATEFSAYVNLIRDLPTTEQILLDPEKTAIPEAPGVLYALTTSLGMKAEQNNFDRMMKFVNRMPTEFQVVFARDAVRRDKNVTKTTSFMKWSVDNANVLV